MMHVSLWNFFFFIYLSYLILYFYIFGREKHKNRAKLHI